MTTINAISPAYRQNVAFRSNDENSTEAAQKPKRHPVKAVLLAGLPGLGEITNGDTKKGLIHAGIGISTAVAFAGLIFKKLIPSIFNNFDAAGKIATEKGLGMEYFKTIYKDVSKKSWAGIAILGTIGTVNAINAAIGTYKGKQA